MGVGGVALFLKLLGLALVHGLRGLVVLEDPAQAFRLGAEGLHLDGHLTFHRHPGGLEIRLVG